MSADSYSACPSCYSEATGKPIGKITLNDLSSVMCGDGPVELGDTNCVREYYEFYYNEGKLHVEYSATCRECLWQLDYKSEVVFS